MKPYERNPRRRWHGKGNGKSSSNSAGSGWGMSDEVMEQMIAAQQSTVDQPDDEEEPAREDVVKEEPAREDVVKEELDVVKEEPASEGWSISIQPDPPSMNDPLRQLFVEATKEWLKANFMPHELRTMVVKT
jgi:hypothetical protein